MKKLKLKALELGAMELLTRSQLKNVLGGDDYGNGAGAGTCCAHWSEAPGNEEWCCGLDKAAAIAKAASFPGGGNWCCDSCQGHVTDNCNN